MKKIYLFLLSLCIFSGAKATFYIIVPSAGGAAYTPSIVNVNVGDVVQWGNSATYPCAQVSQATWAANGTATVAGGFGTQTTSYQMTVTAATGTIYFVCTTKVASNGTKGIVTLNGTVGLTSQQRFLSNLNIFPNPAKSEINLTVPAGVESVNAKLFALNGQLVDVLEVNQNSNTPNAFVLTLSPMITNGVYFLEVTSGDERIYRKIAIAD
ncbi:MAG: T9SS type A sorting domain-containing protein [Bacteroidetes bacterium]|nr:T9SS type A sorting domain-containing protein [Bacteroidota bacterium]